MNGDAPGGEPGLKGNGHQGLDPEELRARMHTAVNDVRPREGTLEYLRWAVPVRRRRRAVVVASSATLVVVSAVVIVVGSQLGLVPHGSGSDNSALAVNGTGSQASGAAGGLNRGDSATHSRDDSPGSQGTGPASAKAGSDGSASPGSTAGLGGTATSPGSAGTATPACTADSFSGVGFGSTATRNGVTYGEVTGTADTNCVLTGPPQLSVGAVSSGAPSATLLADTTGTEGLPTVPTWGARIALSAGQSFQFQFAWVPTGCPSTSPPSTGTGTASGTATTTAPGSPTPPPSSAYTLSEEMGATTVASLSTLTASCGATVYYTDLYRQGAYAVVASGN